MRNGSNKRLVPRYCEEIVNTGDVERLADFVAPRYVELHGGAADLLGPLLEAGAIRVADLFAEDQA